MADSTARLSQRVAVVSPGMRAIATLPALLDEMTLVSGIAARYGRVDAVAAWGRKPSAEVARRFAQSRGVPTVQIEDGFLRSMGLGDLDPPLSVIVDDLGVYYDASTPSRLERQITAGCTDPERLRAEALAEAWRAHRVSKYNHAREAVGASLDGSVLVVDQTFGDAAIRCGQADERSFARMLEAALDEHPGRSITLKVHPDVVAGRKRGHFDRLTPGEAQRVTLLAADAHPPSLFERTMAVYTVSSQMGFEALLWGRPLRCFGMPFYAGWGLSRDELAAPSRRRPAPLHDLVHAALVKYPRYLDPETGQRCEVERLIEHIGLQRRMRERFPPQVVALSFSHWKKPIVRAFFGGSDVSFVSNAEDVPSGATLAVWGRRNSPPQAGEVVRLEDGFMRSVGLGADLVRPLSWVMDRGGMYYDATAPSDLERLLGDVRFDPALIARARALRERIVAQGITKYNVGQGGWQRATTGRPVVLVPGQVESDAAIAWGAPGVRTNIGLLTAVRRAMPDAHIVYKPHPDVVARLRELGEGEEDARAHCDEVVVDVPMHTLLDAVDEVHVLTSLAGFEALLRGRRVVTHGQPFYAGWGLTDDREPLARRQRTLALDELVAGVLILYPTYVSRHTGLFTTAERALDELLQWRGQGQTQANWRRRIKRAVLRQLAAVR